MRQPSARELADPPLCAAVEWPDYKTVRRNDPDVKRLANQKKELQIHSAQRSAAEEAMVLRRRAMLQQAEDEVKLMRSQVLRNYRRPPSQEVARQHTPQRAPSRDSRDPRHNRFVAASSDWQDSLKYRGGPLDVSEAIESAMSRAGEFRQEARLGNGELRKSQAKISAHNEQRTEIGKEEVKVHRKNLDSLHTLDEQRSTERTSAHPMDGQRQSAHAPFVWQPDEDARTAERSVRKLKGELKKAKEHNHRIRDKAWNSQAQKSKMHQYAFGVEGVHGITQGGSSSLGSRSTLSASGSLPTLRYSYSV